MSHPAFGALNYWFVQYRRTWRSSLFSTLIVPTFYLAGIGIGVGGYIDDDYAGVGYLAYLAPGLLAVSAVQTAVGEASWPVYGAIKFNKQYLPMLASPLRVIDIVLGHLGFILFQIVFSVLVFFLTMLLFGVPQSGWAPLAIVAGALTGMAVATPVYAAAANAKSDDTFTVLNRFGVIPMTLFSGVFFPVEQLPALIQPLAWASPLWHGTELARVWTLGMDSALFVPLHVAYLLVWAVVGFYLARTVLTRRLVV